MECLPHDLERTLWSYLPFLALGRMNVVLKGKATAELLSRWRQIRNGRMRDMIRTMGVRVVPTRCVTAGCERKSAQFINLVDDPVLGHRNITRQLHYCGQCLSTFFLDQRSTLYKHYLLIMDMAYYD